MQINDHEFQTATVLGRFRWDTPHVFCDFCRKHNLPGVHIPGAAGYVLQLPNGRESLIGGTCATKYCHLAFDERPLKQRPGDANWIPVLDRLPRSQDEARPRD